MVNEKFTVKIGYLGHIERLKHGDYRNDGKGYAPECLDGKYDHRADVWSFGQVAYNLMMNTTSSYRFARIEQKKEWLISRLDYSVDLLHLIDTALSLDIDSRPFPDKIINHYYFTVDVTKVKKVRDVIPSLVGLNLACI